MLSVYLFGLADVGLVGFAPPLVLYAVVFVVEEDAAADPDELVGLD